MNLNRTEQRFFSDVLHTELSAPTKAKLMIGDDEFPIVVIPQISQNGDFVFRCFDIPAYKPENQDGALSFENGQMFGIHPILEKAWDNQDVVNLKLADKPQPVAPFQTITGPNIQAIVLSVDFGHKGTLSIHKNQIQKNCSTLSQVVFSLVDFSDYKKTVNIFEEFSDKGTTRRRAIMSNLKSIRDQFNDPVEIKIINPARISLHTGEEWEITLTEDENQTRNHTSHSGLIAKTNGKEFEINEVNDLLPGLTQFFAFTSCAYRHPTTVIGEDSKGKTVWGQIGRFDLMPQSTNWFNNDNSVPATVYLESLFPKFWSQWREHPEELTIIIESLVNSKAMQQAGLPKEALATCYTGLDLLSTLVLKQPDPNDSCANVSRALDCHDILNLHLEPPQTPITAQLAHTLGLDKRGPCLISSVRNYVMHPLERGSDSIKQEHREHLDDNYSFYFYLHDLCQFYLEYLLLIGLCGYQPQHFRTLTESRVPKP